MKAMPEAFDIANLPGQLMTIRDYIIRRLNQEEMDLDVLARQTRIQFPSLRVNFSYIRAIRNEWKRASTTPRQLAQRPVKSSEMYLPAE
jgi:hypothetical protein